MRHHSYGIRVAFFSTTAIRPQCRPTNDILSFFSVAQSLHQTQQSHAIAITQGHLPRSVSIAAALILSYATNRSNLSTFSSIYTQSLPFSRSSFLDNTLIRACTIVSNERCRDYSVCDYGFNVYNNMLKESLFPPDDYTFPFVLKLCADFLCVYKGLEVHGRLTKAGLDDDVFVNNTLVLFYGSCGDLRSMEKVFDEMPQRDLVSWNTGIRVFSDNGCWLESLGLFKNMIAVGGLLPNLVSVVSLLCVCTGIKDDRLVSLIHCYVVKVGLSDKVKVGNALIDAYGKCGSLESSEKVFHELVERNDVSWNSMIGSLAYRGYDAKALGYFKEMIGEQVRLNTVTIATMLPTLVELTIVSYGRELHGFCIKNNIDTDTFVANALIDMYGKLKRFVEASNVFRMMDTRNVVSWNSMIGNYAQNGFELDAIKLLREMQTHHEVPNPVTLTNVLPACARVSSLSLGKEIHAKALRLGMTFELFISNALIDMYAKCHQLNLAKYVFDVSLKDEVSYNILINGYSQTSESLNSIKLFTEMEIVGFKHDTVSYMGVLSACGNISTIKEGRQIHAFAVKRLFHEHLFVANSLLDFYTKCGRINTAKMIFDRIPKRDTASWNTMILGFGMLGELETAINLFDAMKEDYVEYDSVSYIAVLSACSHGGLVGKGKAYFDEMLAQNIKPSEMHYACMVDLLGRSGLMEEAVLFINNMIVQPGVNVWGALLGACRVHGNVELGCWAAERLIELKPDHSGYYVLLSNMYAEAGKWDEADRFRKLMTKRTVMKNPGCSWVQCENQVHGFVAGQSFDPSLWLANS